MYYSMFRQLGEISAILQQNEAEIQVLTAFINEKQAQVTELNAQTLNLNNQNELLRNVLSELEIENEELCQQMSALSQLTHSNSNRFGEFKSQLAQKSSLFLSKGVMVKR
jgi:chromosome segregation ATPase